MNTEYTIKTAIAALRAHTSRSLLTILGIVIGVAAIIVVMALGKGAEGLILDEINSIGADTIVIQPGSGDDFNRFLFQSITERDLEAILENGRVPNLIDATPVTIVPDVAVYKSVVFSPTIMGGDAGFFIDSFNIYPEYGVPFGDDAVDSRARVALIGVTVRDELFGEEDPVGKFISIKNTRFRVEGVFPQAGSRLFFDVDELVLVPWTTAQTYLIGADYFNQIVVKVDDTKNLDKAVFDITATMRETHGIEPGDEDDFVVRTQQALAEQVSVIVSILTAFLTAVVAISLVVGGVGIMNIMLVSVTERTREIGLRKALGATRGDIRTQFLYEAVILTGIGGVVGVLIGTAIAFGASVVLSLYVIDGWSFTFPYAGAIIGVVVSAGVGLLFGIYPATQASEKSPMEALRYE
jgi:ABC-type antimicrobial peptide transport system permease subunit